VSRMSHSRIHGREWSIDVFVEHPDVYSFGTLTAPSLYYPAKPRFELSLPLSAADAQRLIDSLNAGERSNMWSSLSFSTSSWNYHPIRVSGISITEEEANAIAREHRDPLDVLFPVWPGKGYRLVAVPDW